ncbi:hypothetical protein Tco_0529177 [Tanacetum coccineum]
MQRFSDPTLLSYRSDNYVPWPSRILRYAKSRPNGKLLVNSIMNGPFVRRMILKPGDPHREVPVPETFHEQTDEELTEKELKQIEADDQAIQTILLQMMKGSDIRAQKKKAKLFNEWERFTSTDGESIESYYHRFSKLMNDFKRNKHFLEKIASNLKFITNLQPEWKRHITTVCQTKNLHEVDYTQIYDFLKMNQEEIAQPGMNMGQDRQIQIVGGNGGNQFGQYTGQNARNQNGNGDLDEIEEVNANCILMANLQQASTSGTQTDKASVYDSDGSAEVQQYDSCYNNDIFNMFTQKEQYTELHEPISEPRSVQQNDSNVISEASSVEQSGGTLEQDSATNKETRAYRESLLNNLVVQVEKVNTVNRKIKEINAELTTEKRLKIDFKTHEDELLDKQILLENRIKELDNILVKTGQSIQMMHMLTPKSDLFYHPEQKMALGYPNPFYLKQAQQKQQSLYNGKVLLEKHDPPAVYDSDETLELAQESRSKMKQLNQEIKPANYAKINQLSGIFVSQTAKSREELYFSNVS